MIDTRQGKGEIPRAFLKRLAVFAKEDGSVGLGSLVSGEGHRSGERRYDEPFLIFVLLLSCSA